MDERETITESQLWLLAKEKNRTEGNVLKKISCLGTFMKPTSEISINPEETTSPDSTDNVDEERKETESKELLI